MQLSMDCPCDLADGLKVVLGESSGLWGGEVGTDGSGQPGKGILGLMVGSGYKM